MVCIHGVHYAQVEFRDYPYGLGVCPFKEFNGLIQGVNEHDARTNAEIVIREYQSPEPVWFSPKLG